jgi:hypothetical protein
MSDLPSGLPVIVGDEEELCRFLTSSNDYSVEKQRPRPRVFLPNPKNHETSVFRHGVEPEDELRRIAESAIPPERKVYGAGVTVAALVRKAELDVISDETPPNGPRHANIVNWPLNDRDPREEKALWKDLANVLASEAELALFDIC